MDSTSHFSIIIIAEVLFLVLVAALVWLSVVRKRLHRASKTLALREQDCATLREHVEQLQAQLEQSKTRLKKRDEELSKVKAQAASQRKKALASPPQNGNSLASYKQRIANLEKFKSLYFELEQRIAEHNERDESEKDNQIEAFRGVIETQNRLIAELKADLDNINDKYELESDLANRLRDTVDSLEEGSSDLKKQLDHANRQRMLAEKDASDLQVYRERTQKLEITEQRLQQELVDYRRKVKELAEAPSAKQYGTVRIQEIEDLSHRLKQRDDELRNLRRECETIALQYEELAMKSLALASEDGSLTSEQRAQLEELKQKLESNTAELSRKQAECEMLENYYLELEARSDFDQTSSELQQALEERDALKDQRQELSVQIESACDPENTADLVQVREELSDRESSLDKIRRDYHEIKSQFIELAQEEVELREQNLALKTECDTLRREINTLREAQHEAADHREELETLRSEYAKMESRYLSLLEKFRDR